jgi:hypothetical protein
MGHFPGSKSPKCAPGQSELFEVPLITQTNSQQLGREHLASRYNNYPSMFEIQQDRVSFFSSATSA